MRRRPVTQRGSILIYMIVVMTVLMAFCSLAVDWGRVQLVRTELRLAADAAARHAALGLAGGVSTVEARAVDAANDNTADGTPVALTVTSDANTTDVQFGTWDSQTRTFTLLSGASRSSANAIRVHCRRTAARGNAVPLLFAQVLGRSSSNATASSTALVTQATGNFGVVGLDSINFGSNVKTDSYNSATGPYSAGSAGSFGHVGSNGDITLTDSVWVRGDSRPGVGRTVTGGSRSSGSDAPLTAALSYPPVDSSPYSSTNNDNNLLPSGYRGPNFSLSGMLTMPAGNYYFTDFRLADSAVLNVTGPVTVYVSGKITMIGGARTNGNRPENLKFKVVGSGAVDLYEDISIAAEYYAPESAVLLSEQAHIYGSIVGRTVTGSGSAFLHYDESLPGGGGGSSSATISLVN